jgi:hypothetical protein
MRAASVDRFIERATSFVRFMEEAGSLALPDRLRRAQAELLGLYREALDLPEVDGGDVVAEPDAVPLADWPGMGDVDGYREVFDPYEHDEPVHASLSDDLRDVYTAPFGGDAGNMRNPEVLVSVLPGRRPRPRVKAGWCRAASGSAQRVPPRLA